MNTALWIVQLLFALMFGVVGIAKLTQPKAKLAQAVRWVDDFHPKSFA